MGNLVQKCIKLQGYAQLAKNFLPLTHLPLPIKQKVSDGCKYDVEDKGTVK